MQSLFPPDASNVQHLILTANSDEIDGPDLLTKATRKRSLTAKKMGNRVLVVGRQRELALYRAEVLRQAGFIVLTAQDEGEAIRIMQRAKFDAVVLSYTIGNEAAQYLADMARDFCDDCPVIAIAHTTTDDDTTTLDPRIAPDAVAFAEEGPVGLVSALNEVLQTD